MFIHNIMNATFYARAGKDPQRVAIYLKVRINGEPVVLGAITSLYTKLTGIPVLKSVMIDQKYWDAEEERVRSACPHAKLLNRAIDICRTRLDKLFAQHEGYEVRMEAQVVKDLFITDTNVKPFLIDLLSYFLKHKADIRANPSTIETYEFKFRPLRKFLSDTRRIKLLAENFDAPMLEQYRTYLIAKRNNKARAADKACQVVKTVLIWATDSRLINANPLANKRIRVDKTPNVIYLTQDEVDHVRTGWLPKPLRSVADCFVFSCYTGLAYQDMKNLTAKHIQTLRGVRCLVGKRQKTDTGYCVPISTHVQTLLDKYGTSLPLPGNDYYNRLLKRVMDKLGIDKEISSHVGRKTFVDWYVNELGQTMEQAVVAMGQKNPSELKPYLRLREQLVVDQFPRELLGRPSAGEAA